LCGFVRTLQKDRSLLRMLPMPTVKGTYPILTSGLGNLMGSIGWQMAFATDASIIAYLGYRHLAPSFVITSRLGLTLMMFGWSLPDSALIGLANLAAEGNRSRTAEVVRQLMSMHLIAVGAIACATLAANASFVRLWVGSDLFGGVQLNALMAFDVVTLTVVHGVVTMAAVLGSRVQIGAITLANGALHFVIAFVLGRWSTLSGVAAATALSALVTSLPVGAYLLASRTGMTPGSLFRSLVLPWAARALPCAMIAIIVGWASRSRFAPSGLVATLAMTGVLTTATLVAYLWSVRGLMKDLPFPPRVSRILTAVRLI
jgi:hypothetical protein